MSVAVEPEQMPTPDENVECSGCHAIHEAGEWRAWIVGRQRVAADPAFCDCDDFPHAASCDSLARVLVLVNCPKCGSTFAVREEA